MPGALAAGGLGEHLQLVPDRGGLAKRTPLPAGVRVLDGMKQLVAGQHPNTVQLRRVRAVFKRRIHHKVARAATAGPIHTVGTHLGNAVAIAAFARHPQVDVKPSVAAKVGPVVILAVVQRLSEAPANDRTVVGLLCCSSDAIYKVRDSIGGINIGGINRAGARAIQDVKDAKVTARRIVGQHRNALFVGIAKPAVSIGGPYFLAQRRMQLVVRIGGTVRCRLAAATSSYAGCSQQQRPHQPRRSSHGRKLHCRL